MLKFSPANSKLEKLTTISGKVYSFDLLAGQTCPFAMICHSEVVEINGKRKIEDGPACQFRCYAASLEALYANVYNLHKQNTEELRGLDKIGMVNKLTEALPTNTGGVRIHTSGDFFSQDYFDAWVAIATKNPNIRFYAYTKAIPYWVARINEIPHNLVLTASYGGTHDDLIDSHLLRSATVVYSESEAADLGLEIDNNDDHAADINGRNKSFALLIHGTQPPGSAASKALSAIRKVKRSKS